MKYYFLGIGGIGMSALARFFKMRGDSVCGYDHTESRLTRQLASEGIGVHYDDEPAAIPPDIDLCVYTPAVPKDTAEYQHIAKRGIPIVKRAQMLGELTRGQKCIAVAGSHGKTTTSSLIAHLIDTTGMAYNAFLGGISKSMGSNMHADAGAEYVVVEADEYDRSFLQLHPYFAVITSTDADHLDIYGTHANLLDAYSQFASQTTPDGHILINAKASLLNEGKAQMARLETRNITTYGPAQHKSAPHAENVIIEAGRIHFDYIGGDTAIRDLRFNHTAPYNVENAVAAITVALAIGAKPEQIRQGIATFKGVQRRFDYRVENERIIYIDDYAHHPIELSTTIQSARSLYPRRRIVGIFQPHLYSRTADFADEFGHSLSALDAVVMLDIYPAREQPIPGVTSQLILDKIALKDKHLYSNNELLGNLSELKADVLLTLGAGDIDRLVPAIEKKLKELYDE